MERALKLVDWKLSVNVDVAGFPPLRNGLQAQARKRATRPDSMPETDAI